MKYMLILMITLLTINMFAKNEFGIVASSYNLNDKNASIGEGGMSGAVGGSFNFSDRGFYFELDALFGWDNSDISEYLYALGGYEVKISKFSIIPIAGGVVFARKDYWEDFVPETSESSVEFTRDRSLDMLYGLNFKYDRFGLKIIKGSLHAEKIRFLLTYALQIYD